MDKSWDTFELLGRFPIHAYPAPALTPQTTLGACFQNFFSLSFNFVKREFCIGWGEGELQENFEKDALFYGSLCTAYFMRETRNYRKV